MKKILLIVLLYVSVNDSLHAQPKQGRQLIDSLLTESSKSKEDTGKVKLLNALGFASLDINEYDAALNYCNTSLALSEKLNFKKGQGNAYNVLGMVYDSKGDYPQALINYKKALKIRQETGDKKGMAGSYNNLGIIYSNQGNSPEALKMYFAAVKINEEMDNKEWLANNYNNLGIIFNGQGNYAEALKMSFAALKIYEAMGDKNNIASGYNNVGLLYWAQKDYAGALKIYSKTLKILEVTGDSASMNHPYNNMAGIYAETGNYPEALKNYAISLKIREKMGDKNLIADSYGGIGIVNQKMNNYAEALSKFNAALKLYAEIDNKNGIAGINGGIAEVNMELKNFTEARNFFNKALAIYKETGNPEEYYYIYEDLAKLDSATADYKSSLANYKMYIFYRDSSINQENNKKLVQTQMQYEFDKKEAATNAEHDKKEVLSMAEIKKQKLIKNSILGGVGIAGIFSFFLVRSVNRRRKTSFEKQVSQVEMKALRAQMNPHFIFNSLNSIYSFIQQNNGEKASDYLIKFSRLMRLILENSNHEEVPLESDLEALGLYMELEAARMNNKFTFSIDVDDTLDKENTLVPPLILQPFVENAIWHGMMHKEKNGLIQINISKNGDMVKCIVEDNGVGREKAKEFKSTTQKGKHESLGMKITNERIAIINRVKKSNAFVALRDLYDDAKKPLGTLVEVQLPLEMDI